MAVLGQHAEGVIAIVIARRLDIGRASVCRILGEVTATKGLGRMVQMKLVRVCAWECYQSLSVGSKSLVFDLT